MARLETPERAKAVLNKARKAVPTSHEIWIAAGRLLEQEAASNPDKPAEQRNKELDLVDRTIEAGVKELRRHQVLLTREQWLKEAERCESEGSPRTCQAIINATVGMDVEEEDRLETWVSDAESSEAKGKVQTARAIFAYALKVFPDKKNLWRQAAELEKTHGSKYVLPSSMTRLPSNKFVRESLDTILSQAVHHCPQAEVLWLMAAKEKWLGNDVPAAREVLERAFVANPESEQIWLAAVKLEAENGELGVARELLVRARTVADTERVSMPFILAVVVFTLCSDLDEVGCIRATTRPTRHRVGDAIHRSLQISKFRQVVHDTRTDPPIAKEQFSRSCFICGRNQVVSQGNNPLDSSCSA